MKIKSDDIVIVIAGANKGQTGKVISVDRGASKLLVEGVNRVFKHVRKSQRNPQGGRLEKEMPVPASNVMLVCPKTDKPTRVGYRFTADGSKERFAKVSGASLGIVSPAKPARVTAR